MLNRKKLTCSTPSCPIYIYTKYLCTICYALLNVFLLLLLLCGCCYSTCISISCFLSLSSTARQTKSLLPTYRRSQSAVSQWRPQLRQQPQLLQQQQQQQHQLIATSSFPPSARSPALLPCQLVLRICLSLYLLQHPLQIKFISQLPVSQAHTHTHRHI